MKFLGVLIVLTMTASIGFSAIKIKREEYLLEDKISLTTTKSPRTSTDLEMIRTTYGDFKAILLNIPSDGYKRQKKSDHATSSKGEVSSTTMVPTAKGNKKERLLDGKEEGNDYPSVKKKGESENSSNRPSSSKEHSSPRGKPRTDSEEPVDMEELLKKVKELCPLLTLALSNEKLRKSDKRDPNFKMQRGRKNLDETTTMPKIMLQFTKGPEVEEENDSSEGDEPKLSEENYLKPIKHVAIRKETIHYQDTLPSEISNTENANTVKRH